MQARACCPSQGHRARGAFLRYFLDGCGWLLRFHGSFDRGDEPVSQSRDGLDIAGLSGGIAKCLAKLLDRGVEPVFEVDEGVGGPKLLPDLLSRDHFTCTIEQQFQDGEGLASKPQRCPILRQIAGAGLRLKRPKTEDQRRCFHGQIPHWVGTSSGDCTIVSPNTFNENVTICSFNYLQNHL